MGGRITVESRQGHGSAFRFTINATPAEMPSTFSHRTEEREQAAPVLSMRLLVVEDNPVNQSVACGILGKMGHRATTANNGREAVRLVQTQRFDAILMDVQMPEMDGLTATARIREWESEHGLRTPIVAMTAHAGEDNRNRCLNAGMDDYVAKPISRSNLADALTRALKGDAPSPAASSASVPSQDFTSEELFNKLDRDEELFAQVAELFLATMPPLLSQLRDEFQRKNFDTATRTAHSLRGSLANIGAAKSAALAAELEELAQKRLSDDAEELLHELKHRVDRIFTELGRHTIHVAAC
jgi:CheY-like chemotaxis protein